MDLDCISSLVTFEHLNLMCRQADRALAAGEPEKSFPPSPGIHGRRDGFSPAVGNDSSSHFTPPNGWDRRTEEALKDDTVTCVPFCFQLPRLLPKCSRAKLMFSTFVQGISMRWYCWINWVKLIQFSLVFCPQNSSPPSGTSLVRRIRLTSSCLIS